MSILATTQQSNLDLAGTETIGPLFNQTQGKAMVVGEWDASELNGFFGGDVFTGTGSLFVSIPEPSTLLFDLTGLAFAGLVRLPQALTPDKKLTSSTKQHDT